MLSVFCCPLATHSVNLTAHRSRVGQSMQKLFGLCFWVLHFESQESKPICNCGGLQLCAMQLLGKGHVGKVSCKFLGDCLVHTSYICPSVVADHKKKEWNNIRKLLQFPSPHLSSWFSPLCFQCLFTEVTSTLAVLLRLIVLNLN